MPMLTIFNINDVSGVVLVSSLLTVKIFCSNFVQIVDFEQEKVCLVHTEKTNPFEDKIGHIMRYISVF